MDYRSYLKAMIRSETTKRGFQGALAKSAGCHASYFSQALSGKVDLTLEQASKIAAFCSLGDLEASYFVNLVLLERSGTQQLRVMTEARLSELREKRFQISGRTLGSEKLTEHHAFYFSSWVWAAIYSISSIKKGQTFEEIKSRLKLSPKVLENHLEKLLETGLLIKKLDSDEELIYSRSSAHLSLSSDSWLLPAFHASMRQLAIEKIHQHKFKGEICYSYFHAIRKEDAEKIRNLVAETLKECHKVVENSDEEEVYLFNCDFLPL